MAVVFLFLAVMQSIRYSFSMAYVKQYDSIRTRDTLSSMFDSMPDGIVVLKESKKEKKNLLEQPGRIQDDSEESLNTEADEDTKSYDMQYCNRKAD